VKPRRAIRARPRAVAQSEELLSRYFLVAGRHPIGAVLFGRVELTEIVMVYLLGVVVAIRFGRVQRSCLRAVRGDASLFSCPRASRWVADARHLLTFAMLLRSVWWSERSPRAFGSRRSLPSSASGVPRCSMADARSAAGRAAANRERRGATPLDQR
jgi:hypothetical protein